MSAMGDALTKPEHDKKIPQIFKRYKHHGSERRRRIKGDCVKRKEEIKRKQEYKMNTNLKKNTSKLWNSFSVVEKKAVICDILI